MDLGWIDLVIILALAAGVFAGFTQGAISYMLNCVAVVVAFVIAAQLKGPILDLLSFWTAFTPEGRELLIFVVLFLGLTVAAWVIIRLTYRRTRLPGARQVDEVIGAIFGLLYAALVITLHLLVYDSFFKAGNETGGWVAAYYEVLDSSLIVGFFRETIVPVVSFLVRPFVPDEIARVLGR